MNGMTWDRIAKEQMDRVRQRKIDALDSMVPVSDSQFRLRACKACKSEETVYIQMQERNGKLWRVCCLGCFEQTQGYSAMHGAQAEWNMHKGIIPEIRRAI